MVLNNREFSSEELRDIVRAVPSAAKTAAELLLSNSPAPKDLALVAEHVPERREELTLRLVEQRPSATTIRALTKLPIMQRRVAKEWLKGDCDPETLLAIADELPEFGLAAINLIAARQMRAANFQLLAKICAENPEYQSAASRLIKQDVSTTVLRSFAVMTGGVATKATRILRDRYANENDLCWLLQYGAASCRRSVARKLLKRSLSEASLFMIGEFAPEMVPALTRHIINHPAVVSQKVRMMAVLGTERPVFFRATSWTVDELLSLLGYPELEAEIVVKLQQSEIVIDDLLRHLRADVIRSVKLCRLLEPMKAKQLMEGMFTQPLTMMVAREPAFATTVSQILSGRSLSLEEQRTACEVFAEHSPESLVPLLARISSLELYCDYAKARADEGHLRSLIEGEKKVAPLVRALARFPNVGKEIVARIILLEKGTRWHERKSYHYFRSYFEALGTNAANRLAAVDGEALLDLLEWFDMAVVPETVAPLLTRMVVSTPSLAERACVLFIRHYWYSKDGEDNAAEIRNAVSSRKDGDKFGRSVLERIKSGAVFYQWLRGLRLGVFISIFPNFAETMSAELLKSKLRSAERSALIPILPAPLGRELAKDTLQRSNVKWLRAIIARHFPELC